jgi:precorrin-2 C20-methyltransferase/precorrin-3B C17-methyltransferase
VHQTKAILLQFRTPDTPVVVGRHVGRDAESVLLTTLGELDPDSIDMSCLLIVGSSRTQRHGSEAVWTARSVDG